MFLDSKAHSSRFLHSTFTSSIRKGVLPGFRDVYPDYGDWGDAQIRSILQHYPDPDRYRDNIEVEKFSLIKPLNIFMKLRSFLLLTSLAFSFMTHAQEIQPIAINAGDIQQLTVVDEMDLVLLQGKPEEKGINIEKDAYKKVDVRLFNNNMEIAMRPYLSKKEKPTLIVFVNDLKKLTVYGNAIVKTRGFLNTSKLDLYVDGSPHVYLVTNGQINAFPMGDNEIDVKKVAVESIKGF